MEFLHILTNLSPSTEYEVSQTEDRRHSQDLSDDVCDISGSTVLRKSVWSVRDNRRS